MQVISTAKKGLMILISILFFDNIKPKTKDKLTTKDSLNFVKIKNCFKVIILNPLF